MVLHLFHYHIIRKNTKTNKIVCANYSLPALKKAVGTLSQPVLDGSVDTDGLSGDFVDPFSEGNAMGGSLVDPNIFTSPKMKKSVIINQIKKT